MSKYYHENRRAGSQSIQGAEQRIDAKWRNLFRIYQSYGKLLYGWIMVENALLILLKCEPLEHLRWLDCYIPGRLLTGSRIPEASKYNGVLVGIILIAQRLIFDYMGAAFNIYCYGAAYFNHQQLKSMLASWLAPITGTDNRGRQYDTMPSPCDHPLHKDFFVNPLSGSQLIRRPTRAPRTRQMLALAHLAAIVVASIVTLVIILGNIWMLGPMFLTRRGFELTRKDCVRHLVTQFERNSTSETHHEHIYRVEPTRKLSDIFPPGRPDPLVLPYSELVPMNAYHLARISVDIVETCAMWLGLCLFFVHHLYSVVGFSVEMIIYVHSLRAQLGALVEAKLRPLLLERLARRRVFKRCPNERCNMGIKAIKLDKSRYKPDNHALTDEITNIQASILDFFTFIEYYNMYMSLSTLIYIIIWVVYIFIVFIRVLSVGRLRMVAQLDNGVQLESFLIFATCSLIGSIILALTSSVESSSRQLYKTMAVAMALDQGITSSKTRWATLLIHFTPKRLYCFTILGNTELSWLFCLKLLSWVISALVILKSL